MMGHRGYRARLSCKIIIYNNNNDNIGDTLCEGSILTCQFVCCTYLYIHDCDDEGEKNWLGFSDGSQRLSGLFVLIRLVLIIIIIRRRRRREWRGRRREEEKEEI